ncbi:centrosomal protein of 68 kDa [Gadus morhua]|uniref:centrosomal protein of 68 kDa n=1 Tax=Gadus morhua TaxID=8049 RepID=UPI0011B4575D|nr:centrosomal protein of 68 kDa [Gadus morhua]
MLRADRRTSLPESPSSMDTPGCSRDWNRRPFLESVDPRPTLNRELGSAFTSPGVKDEEKEQGGFRRYKSVTMAPTSTYLSDRRYVTRRPLFPAEPQASILKKTNVQTSQREEDWAGTRPSASHQHAEIDITRRYSSPRHTVPSTGLNLQHTGHTSSAGSASREDLTSPLGVSDLRAGPSLHESAFASTFLEEGSDRSSLSSPSLEVHSPKSPSSPRLSSTRLPPDICPHPCLSRPLWSDSRPGTRSPAGARGGDGGAETNLTKSSSLGYLKRHTPPNLDNMSPHQANYWACAIPRSLPPSPDRESPSWDANREYQALLDYTYPLRPGEGTGDRKDLRKQGGSLLRTGDQTLQDSGIGLDGFCSSNSLSGLDFWSSGTGKSKQVWGRNGGQTSSELQGLPRSWDSLPLASSLPSHTDPVGLSLESLDSSQDPAGGARPSPSRAGGLHHQRPTNAPLFSHSFSSSSIRCVRSTSLLFPRPRCTSAGDWDEEFRPLPDQLEELQSLANQVREVTATLCQPLTLTGSWDNLESEDPPCPRPLRRPQIPQAKEGDQEELEKVAQAARRGHVRSEGTRGGGDVTGAGSGGDGQTEGPAVGAVSQAALRDVEALVEQLSGVCLHALRSGGPGAEEEEEGGSPSLMQHIQVFCSNLEQLIGWLYTVAHKLEVLAPPTANLESVKSSFAQYQSFQKEVTSHQPLASSVLHTGELLLSCLNSTSPVLRDTLVMIERQTKALESNTENLFSAILSAMDRLAQGQADQPVDKSIGRAADRQTDQ